MSKQSNKKSNAAKLLFFEGIPQKEIAKLLSTRDTTISRWKKEGNWEMQLAQKTTIEQTNEDYIHKMINYQLKTLDKQIDLWEQDNDDTKLKFIQKGEIDALSKLYATIKKKDIEWTAHVKIIREFMSYVQMDNLSLAKSLIPISNDFLNDKRGES